ncbi:uncharacterized protein LACBIDRAFT_319011 [Laccaria bicolor S238N-H82]|uniref:Predicted protein n=1 Tax=Laccaria bicolor (strain S238N-H82 / ATCC MYA-4686) TaxID=486041 RepID=B0D7N2_LACBS|nr:uncharacterized protein LACBIDRAFT_319011 [Laccaria bicolor S238N-H82]EDR09679.1 predicted protein [Laccaria bicolor S238N-H82]|eukprot:XP_001880028.1 predicted protein [Laccaria bicolor S238N-H82]
MQSPSLPFYHTDSKILWLNPFSTAAEVKPGYHKEKNGLPRTSSMGAGVAGGFKYFG